MDFFCSYFIMDRAGWGRKEEVQVGWVSRLKMGEVRWGEGFRVFFLFQAWRLGGRFGCVERLAMTWESPVV